MIAKWVESYDTLRRQRGLGGKIPAGLLVDHENLPNTSNSVGGLSWQ